MNIGLIAHDSKKKLMQNFCIAYRGILCKHALYAAMGATMATYCGQNVGACKLDRLGHGIRACTLLGLGYSVIALCGMVCFAPQCAQLFLDPNELDAALLTELTARYILIQSLFFFPLALVNILR